MTPWGGLICDLDPHCQVLAVSAQEGHQTRPVGAGITAQEKRHRHPRGLNLFSGAACSPKHHSSGGLG